MNKKQAFTMIELLVVIAILAILFAILVPAIQKGISMSQRASCANNLKNIGVALINYASDHEGELPHRADLPDSIDESFQEVRDLTAIIIPLDIGFYPDYISDLSLWHCPSDKLDTGDLPSSVETDPTKFSTSRNCSYMYVSGHHLIRTSESPPLAPLLCDESNKRDYGQYDNVNNMPELGDNDNHGADIRNVLFLDGHVSTIKGSGEGDENVANLIFNNLKNPNVICSVD